MFFPTRDEEILMASFFLSHSTNCTHVLVASKYASLLRKSSGNLKSEVLSRPVKLRS